MSTAAFPVFEGFDFSAEPEILSTWRGLNHSVIWRRPLTPELLKVIDGLGEDVSPTGHRILDALFEKTLHFFRPEMTFTHGGSNDFNFRQRLGLQEDFTFGQLFPAPHHKELVQHVEDTVRTAIDTVFPDDYTYHIFFVTSPVGDIPWHLHNERFIGLNYGPSSTQVVSTPIPLTDMSYRPNPRIKPEGEDVIIERGDVSILGHWHTPPVPKPDVPRQRRLWIGIHTQYDS